MDKRGLSGIITMLIVIGLVLVAIGGVWIIVDNVIESSSENVREKSFDVFDKISRTGGLPESCKEILEIDSKKESGIYTINPKEGVFQVYCDMETDGGGWTLIMKTKEDTNTFHYESNYWTTFNTFQENDLTLDSNDVKYNSFNKIPFTSLRGCVNSANTNCLIHNFGITKNSALDLFNEPEGPTCTRFDNGGTLTFVDFESVFGFDLYDGPCVGGPVFNKPDASCGGGDSRLRWGIYTDEDVNCGSPNEAMGWGLTNDGSAPGSAGSGGMLGRMIHQGKNTWLWVR